MSDLKDKTVEELRYYGNDYWHLLAAFNELASRLAKAQAERDEASRKIEEIEDWAGGDYQTYKQIVDEATDLAYGNIEILALKEAATLEYAEIDKAYVKGGGVVFNPDATKWKKIAATIRALKSK